MKRHVAVDSKRTFAVVLRPEPEGGFTVRVPALPEIVTYGANEAEALAMAKEAIELSLEHKNGFFSHPGPQGVFSKGMGSWFRQRSWLS